MKNILSEIYHGSYNVLKRKDRKGTAFTATLKRMNKFEDAIRKVLPDDVKDVFISYIQAQADLTDMASEEDFISGYQLGDKCCWLDSTRIFSPKSKQNMSNKSMWAIMCPLFFFYLRMHRCKTYNLLTTCRLIHFL